MSGEEDLTDEDFTFANQKEQIDKLFATMLQKYSISEIYEMDILEMLRLVNLEKKQKQKNKKVDSLFGAFGI